MRQVEQTCTRRLIVCVNELWKKTKKISLIKIRLRGKTLRWRQISVNKFLFKVCLTHPTMHTFITYVRLNLINKQKLNVVSFSKRLVLNSVFCALATKRCNIYHGRGVRKSRQILFRKAGKVSVKR